MTPSASRLHHHHRIAAAAVVALAALAPAGCRQPGSPRAPWLGAKAPREKEERIDDGKTADMKIVLARSVAASQPDAAIGLLKEAIALDPSRLDARVRLAAIHTRRGDFRAAAAEQDAVLKAKDDLKDPEMLADLGYGLYLQGRTEPAEAVLRQAVALDPRCARAHNNLGLLLGRAGRAEEALTHFQQAGGSAADCQANLAFALALEGRLDDARARYAAALAAEPRSPLASRGLALVDAARRQAPPADTALRQASHLTPAALRRPARRTPEPPGP